MILFSDAMHKIDRLPSTYEAISRDDLVELVRLLDEEAADPNENVQVGSRVYTPLAWAASYKSGADTGARASILDALIGRGGDPSRAAPLVECKVPTWVERLIQAGAIPDQSIPPPHPENYPAIVYRCSELDAQTVRVLVKNGANFDVKLTDGTPIIFAVCTRAAASEPDFIKACEVVSVLVDGGANINATNGRSETALSRIVSLYISDERGSPTNTYYNLVRFILEKQGDVGHREADGATVLIRATQNPAAHIYPFEMIGYILAYGGDTYINAFDVRGRTALHNLVHLELTPFNRYEDTRQLIGAFFSRGADPNIRDNDGETSLFRLVKHLCPRPGTVSPYPPPIPGSASRTVALDILRFLIANGADKKQPDARGRTPESIAREARTFGQDVLAIVR